MEGKHQSEEEGNDLLEGIHCLFQDEELSFPEGAPLVGGKILECG